MTNESTDWKGAPNFYRLMDLIHEGVMHVDNNDVIQYVNKSICTILGCGKEALLGKTPFEVFQFDQHSINTVIEKNKLRLQGVSDTYEVQVMNTAGVTLTLRISGSPVMDEHGHISGSFGIITDVTEQKHAESKLFQSEKLFRRIFEYAPLCIWNVDADGNILRCNEAAEHFLGYTQEELLTKNYADITFADDASRQVLLHRDLVNGKIDHYELEKRYIHKNGTVMWGDLSIVAIRDASVNFIHSISMVKDITERKLFEEEREKFASLVEHSTDFIAIATLEGNLVFVNKAGKMLVGLEPDDDVLSKTVKDFYTEEAIQSFLPKRMAALKEQGFWKGELALRNFKTNQLIHVDVNSFIVKDSRGNPLCMATIQRNITERKKNEAERERIISELQAALANVKTLSGLLPICAWCKKIRDDKGYWNGIETYFADHSEVDFSHSICPDCAKDFVSTKKKNKLPREL